MTNRILSEKIVTISTTITIREALTLEGVALRMALTTSTSLDPKQMQPKLNKSLKGRSVTTIALAHSLMTPTLRRKTRGRKERRKLDPDNSSRLKYTAARIKEGNEHF